MQWDEVWIYVAEKGWNGHAQKSEQPNSKSEECRVYLDRIADRDRHHRDPGRVAVADAGSREGKGAGDSMPEQQEAASARVVHLSTDFDDKLVPHGLNISLTAAAGVGALVGARFPELRRRQLGEHERRAPAGSAVRQARALHTERRALQMPE